MKNAAQYYQLKDEEYTQFPEQMHCIYRSLYDENFIHSKMNPEDFWKNKKRRT